jgi:hypothetical protein
VMKLKGGKSGKSVRLADMSDSVYKYVK